MLVRETRKGQELRNTRPMCEKGLLTEAGSAKPEWYKKQYTWTVLAEQSSAVVSCQ